MLKKIFSKPISSVFYFLIVLSFVLSIGPRINTMAKELEDAELYATYCSVIDSNTGRVLFEKKGNEQVSMASTTKILTCILVLEKGNLDDYAKTSKYAASMPKVHMGARVDEYYLVEDLLFALMLESYNDAAVILAEYLCGDVESFSQLMNEKAKEIGCKKYHFVTPNGLDKADDKGEHSISATDLSKIMAYCTTVSDKKEDFIRITSASSYIVEAYEKIEDKYTKNGHQKNCVNRNSLLSNPDVISGKTGFTNKAGYCYVCQAQINGRPVSFSLLACGWPNNKTYKWSDSKKIINYIKENYKEQDIYFPEIEKSKYPIVLNGEKIIGEKNIIYPQIELVDKSETYFISEKDEIKYILQIEKELKAPLSEGEVIGNLQVYINEEIMNNVPLLIEEEIRENKMKYCIKEVFVYFIFNAFNINIF